MKKFYILIYAFISVFTFAQTNYSEMLKGFKGHINKIVWNGIDYFPPLPISDNPTSEINLENDAQRFYSKFYNSTSMTLHFGENNANYFTISQLATTFGLYMGENENQITQFDAFASSFYDGFQLDDKFYFSLPDIGTEVLVITNPAGNKIYYYENRLGTTESVKSKSTVYPNPTSDIVTIENLKPNSALELIDSSGKIVKKLSNNKSAKTEINIRNLPAGVYYLRIDNQSVQKIIKK